MIAPVFFLLAVPLALLGGGVGWLFGRVMRLLGIQVPARPGIRALGIAVLIEVGVLASSYALTSDPWLPHEVVADSTRQIDGYVLGEEGSDVLVLQDSPRGVKRLHAHDVVRSLCEDSSAPEGSPVPDSWSNWVADHLSKPLVGIVFGPDTSDYPECAG